MKMLIIVFFKFKYEIDYFIKYISILENSDINLNIIMLGPIITSNMNCVYKTNEGIIYEAKGTSTSYYKIYIDCFSKLKCKYYDIINYFGHSAGFLFGSNYHSTKSPILNIQKFSDPFFKYNIQCKYFICESCYSGSLIYVIELYKISKYYIGTNNYHTSKSFLDYPKYLKELVNSNSEIENNKNFNKLFNKYKNDMSINECKYHHYIVYNNKYIPKLINYINSSSFSLKDFKWSKTSRITNHDNNLYDLRLLAKEINDDTLYNLLTKTVLPIKNSIYEKSIGINKHIYCGYDNYIHNSLFYKILSYQNKKFMDDLKCID